MWAEYLLRMRLDNSSLNESYPDVLTTQHFIEDEGYVKIFFQNVC